MGREDRRKFIKMARKKGVGREVAELYWKVRSGGSAPVDLNEGDHVKLNLKEIQKHPDYRRLSKDYREFVESHQEDIFTVAYDDRHRENPVVVCLKEDPAGWLFWTGNLIIVDRADEK